MQNFTSEKRFNTVLRVACYVFLFILAACATSGQKNLIDFNSQFKQNIPSSPKYKIEPVGRNRFQIVVYQGSALISERTTRSAYLTQAALIVMDSHCSIQSPNKQLGDYQIQDRVDSLGYINVLGFFVCKDQ